MEFSVKVATLKSKYQVMEKNIAQDKNNCPVAMLGCGDLNSELVESLEMTFEQPDYVFRAYADLKVKNCKNTVTKRALTYS